MANKAEVIVSLAVKAGVARCLESDSPMDTLDAYLDDLQAREWSEDDCRRVGSAVLEELMRMLQNEFDSDGGERRAVG